MSQGINEAPFAESDTLGAAQPIASSKLVVMKFGGTSVSSAGKWQRISGLLRNRLASGLRPLVVHSAIGKVTSDLEQILADPDASVRALSGWRRELFGEDALALLRGEIGLTGARGGLRLLRLNES